MRKAILNLFICLNECCPNLSIIIINIINIIRNKKVRIKSLSNNLCIVVENGRKHYFHMKERAHIYKNGIKDKGRKIANAYMINTIKFNDNDTIIDVGANSGDLLIYLSDLKKELQVYAFEPDLIAYNSLEKNAASNQNMKIYNIALSDKDSKESLYISSLGGDTSLSEPESYDEVVEVNTERLSTWLSRQDIDKIKLIKLEAEGMEPEIIKGSEEILSKVEYIAADLGWERGVNQECTIPDVTNYLLSNNFKIISVSRDGSRYLFKKS